MKRTVFVSLLLSLFAIVASASFATHSSFEPKGFQPMADTACCDSIDSIQITPSDSLIFLCDSGSLVLTAPFDTCYTYKWYRNGVRIYIFGLTNQLTVTTPGTYYVEVSNDCYSATSNMVTVVANPAIHISISKTNVSCYGMCNGSASVGVWGGSPSFDILWSTGATTFSINNLCAGTYWFTVTDSVGCTKTDTIYITQPTALTVGGTCNCGSTTCTLTASPSGGTPPYTYLWSSGQTTQQISVPKTFKARTVTVTDANGCTGTKVFTSIQCTTLKSSVEDVAEVETQEVIVYPNPAQEFVSVEFSEMPVSAIDIYVLDLSGRTLMSYIGMAPDRNVYYLNIATLPEGMYFVRVEEDSKIWVNRFIKE